VIAGAIAVGAAALAQARRRTLSVLGAEIKLPSARHIDRRLVLGGLLFGIGWGVAGFCPGPGLAALGMGEIKARVFLASMLVGVGIFERAEQRKQIPTLRAVASKP
jgi:uncharacterized membrane protein YedE/YeeE